MRNYHLPIMQSVPMQNYGGSPYGPRPVLTNRVPAYPQAAPAGVGSPSWVANSLARLKQIPAVQAQLQQPKPFPWALAGGGILLVGVGFYAFFSRQRAQQQTRAARASRAA